MVCYECEYCEKRKTKRFGLEKPKMASDQQPLHEDSSPVFVEEKPKAECCNRYCCYKVFVVIYGIFFFVSKTGQFTYLSKMIA